jgi:hypothetical protein
MHGNKFWWGKWPLGTPSCGHERNRKTASPTKPALSEHSDDLSGSTKAHNFFASGITINRFTIPYSLVLI